MIQPMICCFTGHRRIEPHQLRQLPRLLEHTLEKLIVSGVTVFRAGGAVGFDTLAALAVLKKKETHSQVRLELILPCRDQMSRWGERDRYIYQYVLDRSDSITYVSDTYRSGCMQARNRKLVEGSHFCVAFCGPHGGGTAYTVEYAKKQGVPVINLYE